MTQATRVHSTPRRAAPKIVAGNDFVTQQPDANALEEPLPEQRKRKARGPYKERRLIEYQYGLPVIDPAGEEEIFRYIAEHPAAIAHYDRCVDVEQEAEGKVSRFFRFACLTRQIRALSVHAALSWRNSKNAAEGVPSLSIS